MTISGPWKLLVVVLFVTGLMGCATDIPKTPDYLAVEYESKVSGLRRIALVTDLTPPKIESVDLGFTHGEGALRGAGRGAIGGAAAALEVGNVIGLLLLPFFMLGGAAAGTVTGAVSGYSADMLAEAEANAQYMLNSAYLQTQILERVQDYGHDNTNLEFIRMSCADPEAMIDKPDYTALLEESIDAVLEVELLRLSLEDSLSMDARVRLVSAQSGTVLSDSQFKFISERHKPKEWIANGAAPLTEAIQRGLRTIAEDLVDESFLLYYPNEPEQIIPSQTVKESEQSQAPRNELVPHYVLSPLYPVLEPCIFCSPPFAQKDTLARLNLVKVDSVQPVLRWEHFPRQYDLIEADGQQHQITDVRYDLRIFDNSVRGSFLIPAQQVYQARDLAEPSHKIESGLNACNEYFWTVRARFKLDGRVRVTEWAGAYKKWGYPPWYLRRMQSTYDTWTGRELPDGPEWFYYPFKTPCDSKSGEAPEHENSTPADDDF